jgi:hypothetical protein
MTLQISLSPEAEELLRRRAADGGEGYRDVCPRGGWGKLRSPKSFKEIFAPLQEAFAENPMDEKELDVHCLKRCAALPEGVNDPCQIVCSAFSAVTRQRRFINIEPEQFGKYRE